MTNQKPLFSFGVITDTHIRAPEGDLSSPYPVNDLANSRAHFATALMASQNPAFVIHLGDMVHPLPGMAAYDDACREALKIFSPLQPSLYFVPGNHDIGDKPMPGSPAAAVTDSASAQYSSHFGETHYCFDYQDCSFIVINSSLINTNTQAELTQQQWLEHTLKDKQRQRCILFSHYPLYLHDPDESEHYDNLAQPGRQQLLALTRKFNVEIVFSGHVHHYFFNHQFNTSFYTLPPTSFTRQDYAEIFNVAPAAEYGRDDKDKYSIAIVEVYPENHQVRLLPTGGRQSTSTQPAHSGACNTTTPKNIIVSMRHSWQQSIDLPYNGPMEEFSRKRIRNDYGLLRLLQMGITAVRVPLQDLLEDNSRHRMQAYSTRGIQFHIFCTLAQIEIAKKAIEQYSTLVASLEIVFPGNKEHWQLQKVVDNAPSCPLSIGYACSGAHTANDGKPFAHTVTSGFKWEEQDQILEQLGTYFDTVNSVVFQIPWENDQITVMQKMQKIFCKLPVTGIINLRLAPSNPATSNFDDVAISSRVVSAIDLIKDTPDLRLQLDTFVDVDRGYSPRHGLVDRLYNLREAGRLLMAT